MPKGKPQFNYELCLACHMCEQACFTSAITCSHGIVRKGDKRLYPELSDPESCTGCGICKKACPVSAIEIV